MKYDVAIIGGGLSSLTAGIKLQKSGKKCIIVSSGQNAMHFSSGTFGLLSRMPDGEKVCEPFEKIPELPQEHPYAKIGQAKMREYALRTIPFFKENGVELYGKLYENSYKLTASGNLKSCWLALEDVTLFDDEDIKIGDKVLIVNVFGYLDFNTSFIADNLEQKGAACRIENIRLAELDAVRQSPSEMRSVNIARVMDDDGVVQQFIERVASLCDGEDVIVLPQVFGLKNVRVLDKIRSNLKAKVVFVSTMPPSVPGVRSQMMLKNAFEAAGGIFMQGDEVRQVCVESGRVKYFCTANLGDLRIEARSYILASGGFFGKGLVATPEKVEEPVMGLDVYALERREEWCAENFFSKQNFMAFGVKTDACFHPFIAGEKIENLYVIGAELGGVNSIYEGSGAGVAVMTAFKAADEILG